MGYQHAMPGTPYPPAGHPASHAFEWGAGRTLGEHHLVFILTGEGVLETARSSLPLTPGTAILIKKGAWHRYRPDEFHGWEAYWLGFDFSSDSETLGSLYGMDDDLKLSSDSDADAVVSLFKSMLRLTRPHAKISPLAGAGILLQLLGEIFDGALHNFLEQKYSHDVLLLIDHLRKTIWTNSPLKKIVADGGEVNYNTVRRKFKAQTGFSPKAYFLNTRLESACRLLKQTDLSIEQVAFACGFESHAYFSRIFRKRLAMCPSDWRRSGGETSLCRRPFIRRAIHRPAKNSDSTTYGSGG